MDSYAGRRLQVVPLNRTTFAGHFSNQLRMAGAEEETEAQSTLADRLAFAARMGLLSG